MLDFTLETYQLLLETLKGRGYSFQKFSDQPFYTKHDHVILRHDVDRFPSRALAMARLEADLNVTSTYFFRIKPISFNAEIINSIHKMGHEIGYHYECLSDSHGDIDRAWSLFNDGLKKFDDLCDITSIAMHGRPFSSYDNKELWKYYDYRELGVLLEAYLDIPWDRYTYLTDVGGKWNSKHNLRDHAPDNTHSYKNIASTFDLVSSLDTTNDNLIISTHPERWPRSVPGWVQARILDIAADQAKILLGLFRN